MESVELKRRTKSYHTHFIIEPISKNKPAFFAIPTPASTVAFFSLTTGAVDRTGQGCKFAMHRMRMPTGVIRLTPRACIDDAVNGCIGLCAAKKKEKNRYNVGTYSGAFSLCFWIGCIAHRGHAGSIFSKLLLVVFPSFRSRWWESGGPWNWEWLGKQCSGAGGGRFGSRRKVAREA